MQETQIDGDYFSEAHDNAGIAPSPDAGSLSVAPAELDDLPDLIDVSSDDGD